MYRYKRLMVALNLSDQDIATLRYAKMVSGMAKSEKIYFVHVVDNRNIPEGLRIEYPGLLNPVSEFVEERMENMVNEHFRDHHDAELVYDIVEGSPLAELLHRARDKEIDLLLAGRKREGEDSGTLPAKLVRKAPCSVLIIPEGIPPGREKITKVLVPVDFSGHSADAMEVAIAFASASNILDIDCLHVYRVPSEPHRTGYARREMSYAALVESAEEHAEREYGNFIRQFDLKGLFVNPVFRLDNHPAKVIRQMAQELQADLLVMGARGRTAAAAVLLGSVTERLIRTTEIPLLAVKEKGAGMGLLEALNETREMHK